jgi:hypothetical protein
VLYSTVPTVLYFAVRAGLDWTGLGSSVDTCYQKYVAATNGILWNFINFLLDSRLALPRRVDLLLNYVGFCRLWYDFNTGQFLQRFGQKIAPQTNGTRPYNHRKIGLPDRETTFHYIIMRKLEHQNTRLRFTT